MVPKTLTGDECFLLLSALAPRLGGSENFRLASRNALMALLMLDAGLRVGELVQLQWADLWLSDASVHTLRIRSEIAKNKHERTVPLSDRIQASILAFLNPALTHTQPSPGRFVFLTMYDSHHISTRQVERIIRKAAMKALGRPITPHVLRHTFATRLMATTSLRVVQELLGHKNVSSTQIYTHPNEDDKKRAVQSLCIPTTDGEELVVK